MKADRQVASLEMPVCHVPNYLEIYDKGALAILLYFQRKKKPSLKEFGNRTAVPFPCLTGKQKTAKKQQVMRDAVCDAEMLAIYK